MIDRPQDLSLPSMLVGSLAIVPAMVAVGVLVIMTATTQTAQARVTRIVVNERISPAFNGRSFGTVGQYEQLNGIAYGEVDPQDPQNVIIQDIGLAPRNRDGKVEYSMDISILKPLDSTKGNHVLLYDVVNRGRKLVTGFFNIGATAAIRLVTVFLRMKASRWCGVAGKPTLFLRLAPARLL
jgi:hypothetical protein